MESSSNSKSNGPPHTFKAHRRDGRGGSRLSRDRTPPPPPAPHRLCDPDASSPSSELRPRVSVIQSDDCTQSRGQTIGQECGGPSMCERGDGCETSSDKGCSLPKRAPGCEKFVSIQSLASVSDRSDDTVRVLDPNGDKAARSYGGKRGRTDHHSKGNISEQRNKSEFKEKPDADGMVVSTAARKGSGLDKKRRSNGDDHFPKGSVCSQGEPSALGREGLREAKSALKASIKSSDHGSDRVPSMEKKDVSVGRLPLKKAFKTMRALIDVGNLRDYTVEKPEHGSSLGGENTGAPEKISSSKSSGGGAEDGKDLQGDGTLPECGESIHDFPINISRISKRARSHRDRRSHEKLATKGGDHEEGQVKLEETSKQEDIFVSEVGEERNGTDSDSEARDQGEDDAGASSKGADATEELPTKKEEGNMEDSSATRLSSDEVKGSIERREVQLKSEGNLAVQGHSKASNRTFNKQGNIDCNRPVEMPVCVDPDERTSLEGSAMESQENGHTVFSHEDGGRLESGCDRKEHKMVQDRKQAAPSAAGAAIVTEVSETSQGELPLSFLDEGPAGQKKHVHQTPVDGGLDTSKQLTLSLFAKHAEAQGEEFEVKGLTMMEDLERGKHLQRALYNVGEHISYGYAQKPSKVGYFQLSLAIPGTSTAGEGSNASNAKGLVAPEGSVQSPTRTQTRTQAQTHTHNFSQSQSQTQNFSQSQARTNSDGFTTSLSFSQSFLHNPSCSLNCASLENQELSCGGSRQISQGNENFSQRSWQTASANEHHGFLNSSRDRSKHTQGNSLYQWALQNGSMHGFPSASGSSRLCENNRNLQWDCTSGQKVQVDSKMLDSSSQDPNGSSARVSIKLKDLADRSVQEEEAAWHFSAARETQSEPLGERDREKERRPASPSRRYSSAKNEDARGDHGIHGGKIGLQEIATEPVAVMAQMMQELPDSFLAGLKGLAKDLLGSFEKRGEFLTLQSIVKSRTDLTEHNLLHAHQTQLEILVAFKTGVQEFVQEVAKPLTYKVLTEIFLQTRCRNITCQQSLPVDGCDCKICSQKGGFCHECMCVVCSKFDSDYNTCRWVGCEVCMHWCHTDCGLRMLYVAPAQGAAGSTEMQYQCAACGHRSELFGFVKSVFHQFADSWGTETLTKELDCVRRIFHGSADVKGRQLCAKVEDMLQKLEKNVETAEIQRSIMQYFSEANADRGGACTTANADRDGACSTANKQSKSPLTNVDTDRMPMAAQEAAIQMAPRVGNKDVDKAHLMLQSYERERFAEKMNESTELHVVKACKRAEIEDIHSRVRIKQAEATMLQRRADEAHQEARGLQQIIIVKHKLIEDDYVHKYGKLRLNEVEEKRRKRFLELQALERAEVDYQKMKIRMEAQIKDLAMKMEMADWQYA